MYAHVVSPCVLVRSSARFTIKRHNTPKHTQHTTQNTHIFIYCANKTRHPNHPYIPNAHKHGGGGGVGGGGDSMCIKTCASHVSQMWTFLNDSAPSLSPIARASVLTERKAACTYTHHTQTLL